MAKPIAIYISLVGHGLSIHAPQERFGYEMKPWGQDPDEHDLVYYDDQQRPIGLFAFKFAPTGRYEAYDPRIVDCLERHKENQKNGGGSFFKVDQNVIEAARTMTVGAEIPDGGITEEHQILLSELNSYSDAGVDMADRDQVLQAFADAVEKFDVTGVRSPKAGDAPDTMRVRVSDLLEILSASGIESEPENERRDTG